MPVELKDICAALKTTAQLTRAGVSRSTISAQHRRQELLRLTRGVYIDGAQAQEYGPTERAIAVTAALAKNNPAALVSHQSAALLWGAPLMSLPPKVHLTLRSGHKNRHRQAILHSARPELFATSHELCGIRVTDPYTTIADCGKALPVYEGLAIADFFLRHHHLSPAHVRAYLENLRGPGAGKIRIIGRLMSAASESPLESFAIFRLYEAGLEMPSQQYELITPSGRLYRADAAWPDLGVLLEVDGLHKYFGAYRPVEAQLRNDMLRQRELELAGWTVVRATWEDVAQRPEVLISRLKQLGVGRY